jgi:serine/threonine protein phosphatase PrpC
VHGEHRPQVSQAFILGNAFSDTMQLNDPLFELTASILPPWLGALADRRAIALKPGASYLLATDGLWSCSDPAGWVSRWPHLLAERAGTHLDAAAMLTRLLDAYDAHPAAFFYPDNVSAVLLRVPAAHGHDATALPGG